MGFKKFLQEKIEQKEYSEKELKARQDKKTSAVKTLQSNISKLKSKLSSDLSSQDEKTKLTALVISIINQTSERVGNDKSANGIRKDEDGKWQEGQEKHYGVTGLRNSHVTFSNGKAILSYIGKSGVKQKKEIKDSKVVSLLKELKKKNKDFLFVDENGTKVSPTNVNTYLKDFDVTAKDLRAFQSNSIILKMLKGSNIPKDEKERKDKFLEIADKVAEILGHGRNMLRNSYLLPDLESSYIEKGKIISL